MKNGNNKYEFNLVTTKALNNELHRFFCSGYVSKFPTFLLL